MEISNERSDLLAAFSKFLYICFANQMEHKMKAEDHFNDTTEKVRKSIPLISFFCNWKLNLLKKKERIPL